MSPAEILARFVSKPDYISYYLHKPFDRGNYTYATNSHIAARVPKIDGFEPIPDDKLKKLEELFDGNSRDDFVELTKLPHPEKCTSCNGSGVGYKCPSCDGEGDFEHEGHEYDCKECGGSGEVDDGDDAHKQPCWKCDGSGHAAQPVKVGAGHFDRRYLAKLMELPGVKFAPHPSDPMRIAYFTFDGGEGLLMPMRV